jgi:hypothetical protein
MGQGPQASGEVCYRTAARAIAGQVSAGLSRCGIATHVRVHIRAEDLESPEPPMAAIAEAGKGFDWLAEEPDLYSNADLVERAS